MFRFGSESSFLSPLRIIVITVLVDMVGFGMIIPLIPFYARDLNAGAWGIGVLLASFSIMQFLFAPLLGRMSDRAGRRPVLLFSILTSIGSFLLFIYAQNYLMLLLSRIIAGLATEGAVAQAYVADITTSEERSKGIGRVGAATGVGFILGPVLGGLLSPYGFWAPGAAAFILGVINFIFVFLLLPEPPVHRNSRLSKGWFDALSDIRDAVKEPLTGKVFIIYFIITLAFAAIPVIIPLLGIEFYNFTEVEMSYIFIFIGIIQALLQGVAIGKMVKRLGEEKLIVFGPLFMMFGLMLMPLINNLLIFALSLFLISVGVGITNTVVPSFISLMTSQEEQGGVLGITQSIGSIARIPGPLLGGITAELGGIGSPFYISGILLLVPFILACRVFRVCTVKELL